MVDSNFFNYSAKSNNCQDMILNIMDPIKIGDESDRIFVKQDTDFLFENLPFLRKFSKRKFSNTITTIGARADAIKSGAGFKRTKNKR